MLICHQNWFRLISARFPHIFRSLHVLGIETSCDDAAVSIVNFENRKVLTDKRSADHASWDRVGGVLPFAADFLVRVDKPKHRAVLDRLVDEALADAHLRASDLDAVAVSTRPGIVISLKVGIEYALAFARNFRRPLVPVHHMRSHALVARLLYPKLEFPFTTLLASGAHCLICLVKGPNEFYVMADSSRGSPGECLDKLARALGLRPKNGSFGAALEQWANRCSPERVRRYSIPLWQQESVEMEMDFDRYKSRYLKEIEKTQKRRKNDESELATWCAGIQHSLTKLICARLDTVLAFLIVSGRHFTRNLVVAGGVASNAYFIAQVRRSAEQHGFEVVEIPPNLCMDNGVMVAVAGAEIFAAELMKQKQERYPAEYAEEPNVFYPSALPDTIWASYRAPIGPRFGTFLRKGREEKERNGENEENQNRNAKNIIGRVNIY